MNGGAHSVGPRYLSASGGITLGERSTDEMSALLSTGKHMSRPLYEICIYLMHKKKYWQSIQNLNELLTRMSNQKLHFRAMNESMHLVHFVHFGLRGWFEPLP